MIEGLTKDWLGWSYIALTRKPIIIWERTLISIGYKLNSWKILPFVSTAGAKITTLGIPNLSKYNYQFSDVLISPVACPLPMSNCLAWLMKWNHTESHFSWILHWRSLVWYNVVVYGCVILLIWLWQLTIVGNCFATGLIGKTKTCLLVSRNSKKIVLLIASVILSQQKQGLQKECTLTWW